MDAVPRAIAFHVLTPATLTDTGAAAFAVQRSVTLCLWVD